MFKTSPHNDTSFRWFSRKRAFVIFLYSLLFLVAPLFEPKFKLISNALVLSATPFLPFAYMPAMFFGSLLKFKFAYQLGAWLAVFLQAYLLISFALFITHKSKRCLQTKGLAFMFSTKIRNMNR